MKVDFGLPKERPAKPAFFISPNSKALQIWQSVVSVSIIITTILDTFLWSFDSRFIGIWVVTYLTDAVFIIHIVTRFFVGYFKNGIEISDRKRIRQHYVKTTFFLDLFTVLPLELFAFSPRLVIAAEAAGVIVSMKYMAILRCNRLFRLYFVFYHFDTVESRLGTSTKRLMTAKYLTIAGLSVHVMACVWYTFGCVGQHYGMELVCREDSWAVSFHFEKKLEEASSMFSYLVSLYWTVTTATSTGYGDIHPSTIGEQWFSIFAMLVGIIVFFGIILGGLASLMTNMDTQRAFYSHRLNVIKEHLMDANSPKDLQQQVIRYYEYLWIRRKGVTDEGLMNQLPITFHAEVSHSANKIILDKAPMFKNLSPGFLRMVSLEMKPVLYLPKQIISGNTELSQCMQYVQRGEIEVLSPEDNETPIMTLRCGSLFGEVSVVSSQQRSHIIRAAAHCDLVQLDKADLNNVLAHYPGVGKQLQELAEERFEAARKLAAEIKERKSHVAIAMTPSTPESEHSGVVVEEPQWVPVHHPSCFSRLRRWLSRQWQNLRDFDWIFMPDSAFIRCWQYFILLISLIVTLMYPYVASFIANQQEKNPENTTTIYAFMFIMDILIFLDIPIRIRTAHVTPNGTFKDFKSIRENYIQTWGFVFDVLAALPLHLFSMIFSKGPVRTSYVYMLSLNRLIKFFRVNEFLQKKQRGLGSNIGSWRFCRFVILIVLYTHWSSCAWYLGLQGNTEDEGQGVETLAFQEYIHAIYWTAATMTSTGYGDVLPYSCITLMIAIMVEVGGLLLFGYGLSSIAATLTNNDSPRVNFQEKLTAVKQFMKDHSLGDRIQGRVVKYMTMVFQRHRGEQTPGGRALMYDMPIQLQQDIAYLEAKDYFEQVPLLQDCDECFLKRLALKTHMFMYSPGDKILTFGDQSTEMYFIRKGTCEVLSKDDKEVLGRLVRGSYFGEIGLFFGVDCMATVVAASYCEILVLTSSDFYQALDNFPLIARQFKKVSDNKEYLTQLKEVYANQEALEEYDRVLPDDNELESGCFKKVKKSVKDFITSDKEYEKPFESLGWFSRQLAKCLMSCTFLPDGFNVLTWEGCRVLIGMMIPFIVILQIAFAHMSSALWVFCYGLDVICFIDLYMKFHYAFYNDDEVLITHPLETAKHYLRGSFVVDLLACFPFEIFAYAAIQTFSPEAVHIYAVLRVNRLLQLYRMPLAFSFLEVNMNINTGTVREVKFLFYLILFFHTLSCLWYFQACPPVFVIKPTEADLEGLIQNRFHYCLNNSWTVTTGHFLEKPLFSQWAMSLYWAAATGASVGYGDLHATANNYTEMSIATLCMITGILFFGYIIASVFASLANADAQRAKFQEKVMSINRYLKEENVDRDLCTRINDYYLYLWQRTQGIDPDTLFDGLNFSLKADVSVALYADMINKVPLFQGTDEGFQKMLAMHIKPIYIMGGEYVVRKFDVGQHMFFIHRGGVDVVSEDGKIVFDSMMAGRFFGEISLVMSCHRTASIRAQGNVDMFVLGKEDLEGVLVHYPSIEEQINEVAQERFSAVRKRSQARAASQEQSKLASKAKMASQSTLPPDTKDPSQIKSASLARVEVHDEATTSAQDKVTPPTTIVTHAVVEHLPKGITEAELMSRPGVKTESVLTPHPEGHTQVIMVEPMPEIEETIKESNDGQESSGGEPPSEGADNNNASHGQEAETAPVKDMEPKKPESDITVEELDQANGPVISGNENNNAPADSKLELEGTESDEVGTSKIPFWQRILKLNRFTLAPSSFFLRFLADTTCALIFLTTMTIIFQVAYQYHSAWMMVFNYLCELVFIFEIYIKFHISCADEYGELEQDFGKVYRLYLKNPAGFALDLAASIPLEIFALCFPEGHVFKAFTCFRLTRLIRFIRVNQFFSNWEKELDIDMLKVRLTKMFVFVTMIIHIFASIWYMIACPLDECKVGSWVEKRDYLMNDTIVTTAMKVTDSTYWCVATLTSTGYGDITAHSDLEMLFASLTMIVGQLLVGSVLGNIASTLANRDTMRVAFEKSLQALKDQMIDYNLDTHLMDKVINYFDYMWMRNKGVDQHSLFSDAPYCLQTELAMHVNGHHLRELPLFDNVDEAFFRAISLCLMQRLLRPGDDLVQQGDVGNEMYFIHKGMVEVMRENHPNEVDYILGENDYFDSIHLLHDLPRRRTVRAVTHVDALTLSMEDLNNTLVHFPQVADTIRDNGVRLFGSSEAE